MSMSGEMVNETVIQASNESSENCYSHSLLTLVTVSYDSLGSIHAD